MEGTVGCSELVLTKQLSVEVVRSYEIHVYTIGGLLGKSAFKWYKAGFS